MAARQPNILLFFTDQQRFDTIAALGNDIIRTPVMDRLANEGVAFTRCFTPSPVCVAARCALMTGLPPHVTGCTHNNPMPTDQPSIVERLHDAGYQTHGVGKMHFSPDLKRLWGYDTRDISEEIASGISDYMRHLHAAGYEHVIDPAGIRSEYYYIPQPAQCPAHLHETHWVADKSIEFLQRRDRSRPFFMMTSFIKPHPPFENPTPWNRLYRCADMPDPHRPDGYEDLLTYHNQRQNRYKYRSSGYDRELVRTMRAAYYACVSFIDYNVGRVIEALGADIDNTLIVFTADHGELLGDYGSFGKRSMLDVGCRVPMLVRQPGAFAGGGRCDAPVSLLDIWPTFLTAAGQREVRRHADGEALQSVLADAHARQVTFSQYDSGGAGLYMSATRTHKYYHSAADQREWLFDLVADPHETRNVAGDADQAGALRTMRGYLFERFTRDGYRQPLNDEMTDWAAHEIKHVPDDPDEGLLMQDPAVLKDQLAALGPYGR